MKIKFTVAMKNMLLLLLVFILKDTIAQSTPGGKDFAARVNVFLGSSGDHGQMSPAASYPFSMMSIGPQTYPNTHTGYEYEARKFLGFTHNRIEGVGCMGSGGNILIKPFLGKNIKTELIKTKQEGQPGYYHVNFTNGIRAEMTVFKNSGIHRYLFEKGNGGFYIDLSHTLSNEFVAEAHKINGRSLSGWIESKTTCNVGKYKVYYYLELNTDIQWKDMEDHKLSASFSPNKKNIEIKIAFSSLSTEYAKSSLYPGTFNQAKTAAHKDWNEIFNTIDVSGNSERGDLFYSLLYRTVQSPYVISEKDGAYKAIDGTQQQADGIVYNGWAIWDNYRTQLPLLSIAWPQKYQNIASSIANLYNFGKKDFATQNEPSNTVRTEHAIVVLLDAYRKGYDIKFDKIIDSLIAEAKTLDFSRPDKALESSYDIWALSEILAILGKDDLSKKYKEKALEYKNYWNKDFKDLSKPDVDKMQARGLYQGTIWQYRWFVPFDLKGLINLIGGNKMYISQLDEFFDNDLYNHANEPDIQVPLMYNASDEPWKSQELMHRLAVDTIIQYYFNDNSRGIDPFIDKIYKNEPKAYIRTMDDDAGAMSGWYIFAACGFSPACIGWPVYYLNVPLFKSIEFKWPGKRSLIIEVENYSDNNKYIKSVTLNGKQLNRNYITHEEIMGGGKLVFVATGKPDLNWGINNQWISEVK